MNKKSIAVAASLLVVSAGAAAQQAPNFYAGISVGSTKGNLSASEIDGGLRAQNYVSPSTSVNNTDTAFRFAGGYRFSPIFSLEAYYTDLGEYSSSSKAGIQGVALPGTVDAKYKSTGFGVDAVLSAPLTEGFSIYGRAGVLRAKTEGAFSATGTIRLASAGAKVDKTAHTFGVGLQYDINKQFGVRLEAQRYNKLGDDSSGGELRINQYSLGGIINF
jgi:OmpA-OmpF porin, OOP family